MEFQAEPRLGNHSNKLKKSSSLRNKKTNIFLDSRIRNYLDSWGGSPEQASIQLELAYRTMFAKQHQVRWIVGASRGRSRPCNQDRSDGLVWLESSRWISLDIAILSHFELKPRKLEKVRTAKESARRFAGAFSVPNIYPFISIYLFHCIYCCT